MSYRTTDGKRHRAAAGLLAAAFVSTLLVVVGSARPAAAAFTPCTSCQPTANDDVYTVAFGQELVVPGPGLLANDSGPTTTRLDGDPTSSDTLTPGGATITYTRVNGVYTGGFTYTPDPNQPFSGIDSFGYSLVDLQNPLASSSATVTINVPAVVRNDTYYIGVNHHLVVGGAGVLANDIGTDPTSLVLDASTAQGSPINDDLNGAFDYIPPQNFQGTDTFGYTVYDLDADIQYTATVTIHVDSTPPTVWLSAPGVVTLGTTVGVKWGAIDTNAGVKSFDVSENVATASGSVAGWKYWRTATTTTSGTITGIPGYTYCFDVRARDNAGNTSAWVRARCTTIPIRSTGLNYSSGWFSQTSNSYYAGIAKDSKASGARMTRGSLQVQHLYLIATKCSYCGAVQVRLNGVVVANVNLSYARTVNQQVIAIGAWSTMQQGTVTVTVTSPNGKLVVIEGLGVLHA